MWKREWLNWTEALWGQCLREFRLRPVAEGLLREEAALAVAAAASLEEKVPSVDTWKKAGMAAKGRKASGPPSENEGDSRDLESLLLDALARNWVSQGLASEPLSPIDGSGKSPLQGSPAPWPLLPPLGPLGNLLFPPSACPLPSFRPFLPPFIAS